jgi:hypothetical protein
MEQELFNQLAIGNGQLATFFSISNQQLQFAYCLLSIAYCLLPIDPSPSTAFFDLYCNQFVADIFCYPPVVPNGTVS